jgi:hypothetical protein
MCPTPCSSGTLTTPLARYLIGVARPAGLPCGFRLPSRPAKPKVLSRSDHSQRQWRLAGSTVASDSVEVCVFGRRGRTCAGRSSRRRRSRYWAAQCTNPAGWWMDMSLTAGGAIPSLDGDRSAGRGDVGPGCPHLSPLGMSSQGCRVACRPQGSRPRPMRRSTAGRARQRTARPTSRVRPPADATGRRLKSPTIRRGTPPH